FYRKFSNTSQIEDALQEQEGLSIDGEDGLHEFAKKQLQQVNLGQAQNNDDLYNVACRIVAVTMLKQLAVGGAYNKYSINFSFITKTGLFQCAYDHFVHYRMKMGCDKEARIPGSFEAGAARSSSNKNRSRLRDARQAFAIVHKFPKRYCRITDDIASHRDDEEYPKGSKKYAICTSLYCSRQANIFFQNLVAMMAKEDKTNRSRLRVLPKVPVVSQNSDPPKQLPIDFYNVKLFKAQTEMRRRTIPDWNSVAFLENPEESLEGQVHPDEKLSDKGFNKKFREAILKAYPMPVQNDHSEEDSEIENEGGSIDLEAPSVNKDEEDNYFYAPGEYAYDEENESNSEGSDYMMDEVEDV
ncbi:hypothetical protein O181_104276, partial [Austropuccinia psidii MF-1]|nr:hypothetical protein [Austropuccinia psidii MF-1]